MPYIVRNLYANGSRSVGSRPLTLAEAIESVTLRTGTDGATVGKMLRQMSSPTIVVDGCGLDGYNHAQVEHVPQPTCPDCGRPITLQRSGWWSHDGLPDGCWRLSMDGPDE